MPELHCSAVNCMQSQKHGVNILPMIVCVLSVSHRLPGCLCRRYIYECFLGKGPTASSLSGYSEI